MVVANRQSQCMKSVAMHLWMISPTNDGNLPQGQYLFSLTCSRYRTVITRLDRMIAGREIIHVLSDVIWNYCYNTRHLKNRQLVICTFENAALVSVTISCILILNSHFKESSVKFRRAFYLNLHCVWKRKKGYKDNWMVDLRKCLPECQGQTPVRHMVKL